MENLVCEVCNKPAVSAVLDVRVYATWESPVRQIEPESKPHYFCAEHSRESKVYDIFHYEI